MKKYEKHYGCGFEGCVPCQASYREAAPWGLNDSRHTPSLSLFGQYYYRLDRDDSGWH